MEFVPRGQLDRKESLLSSLQSGRQVSVFREIIKGRGWYLRKADSKGTGRCGVWCGELSPQEEASKAWRPEWQAGGSRVQISGFGRRRSKTQTKVLGQKGSGNQTKMS